MGVCCLYAAHCSAAVVCRLICYLHLLTYLCIYRANVLPSPASTQGQKLTTHTHHQQQRKVIRTLSILHCCLLPQNVYQIREELHCTTTKEENNKRFSSSAAGCPDKPRSIMITGPANRLPKKKGQAAMRSKLQINLARIEVHSSLSRGARLFFPGLLTY